MPRAVPVLSSLLLGTVLLLPAPAHAAPSGTLPDRRTVLTPAKVTESTKFYVVEAVEENGGRPETLADIAARTLGSPDRFQEILVLNTGRQLADGSLFLGDEQVVPGFALRLPADAEGEGVQFGVLPEANSRSGQRIGPGTGAPVARSARAANPFASIGDRVPVPVLIGGIAGVTALTVAVIARRRLARALRAVGRGLVRTARVLRPRLPRPVALALLRRRRAALAGRLAADTRTPVLVRGALDELARAADPAAPTRVYTVRADPGGLLASVSAPGRAPEPWVAESRTGWRRAGLPDTPGGSDRSDGSHGSDGSGEGGPRLTLPHLARVGVDAHGAQVMVGLGQLDGALSVRGDLRVARDTVTALADGLLELPWQDTVVVAVDPAADALPGVHGVVRVRSVAEVRHRAPEAVFDAAEGLGLGLVRSVGGRGVVAGFLLVPRPVDADDAGVLAELASPRGGWTVLAVGDVPGAHWRWYAEPEGVVDLGVLGLKVTVPARRPAAANVI
ncbi:hypothetical protein [Streptomyces sp. NPDC058953]|uniref:hypothetical protein n=1 Tax=unclassified Streptomyces TaxID=2593676 RepID=UPI00368E27AE